MEKIKELLRRFSLLDIDLIMFSIMEDPQVQRKAIELNQKQLLSSRDAQNERLLGASGNLIDLYETGQFYETFQVENRIGGFDIVANTAIYGQDFRIKYSPYILGLTDDSIREFQNFLLPLLQDYLYTELTK